MSVCNVIRSGFKSSLYELTDGVCSSYRGSLTATLLNMKQLYLKGFTIKWSFNERWCVIDGKTFNVAKVIWDKYVKQIKFDEENKDSVQ